MPSPRALSRVSLVHVCESDALVVVFASSRMLLLAQHNDRSLRDGCLGREVGDVALDVFVRELMRAERRQAGELDATTLLQLTVRREGGVVTVQAETADRGGEVGRREDRGREGRLYVS